MDVSSENKPKGISRRRKMIAIFLICMLLLGGTGTTLFVAGSRLYSSYHQSVSLAQTGIQHLRKAETLLETMPKHPFDEQVATQAQQEFSSALTSFLQLKTLLKSLPGVVTWIPTAAASLKSASHLVPFAISASQAGIVSCQFLEFLVSKFHGLADTKGQGLTMVDMAILSQKFGQAKQAINGIINQSAQIQPSDLQLDPHLSKVFASLRQQIPTIQNMLGEADQIFAIAPALLGISAPASYLVEVLDSTELRPGGGFIGNYGIVNIQGGRLISAPVTDSYLLDRPFEDSGKQIPFPTAYSWFDIAPTWSFRDSNLDADFPTAAVYGERNYEQEGGKGSFQGVIAITPALIQHALAITGPIAVPEYHEIVTAQNLISLIHYYQLGKPSLTKQEATRKRFTALLAKHFFDRLHEILPSTLPRFLQLLSDSFHTKDIQIYLNASQAENLLKTYHLDASIQPTPGDGLMVVDANIGATKSNPYTVSKLTDRVTIDAQGNVTHHTTISYAWTIAGPDYSNSPYRDYVRVYAPPGSTLQGQQGWQARGTSEAFGHTVWAGFFTLTYGQQLTVTLQWTDHNVAKKDASGWHYEYLIQRQAGVQWNFSLQVALPSCATRTHAQGGLVSSNTPVTTYTYSHSLIENSSFDVDYTC